MYINNCSYKGKGILFKPNKEDQDQIQNKGNYNNRKTVKTVMTLTFLKKWWVESDFKAPKDVCVIMRYNS